MRILAAVCLLAVAAQCQTTNPAQGAPVNALPAASASVSGTQFSSSKLGGPDLLAQLSVVPSSSISDPGLGSSAAGRPIIKTAVLKPNKISTVDERHARNTRAWYSLIVVEHAAAGFDAYSTRQSLGHGGQELNPLLKPFANSAAIYPALQVWPTGMDFVSNRMMRSSNRVLRRTWWVPQVASTVAFVTFGIHNLGVHAQ